MTNMPGSTPVIVWFRRDLRLQDNPALLAACRAGGPVLPVFIWAPREEKAWVPGAVSRWWLHHSLASLDASLAARGSRLVVLAGDSADALLRLARKTGARTVFWNRLYEPALAKRDAQVGRALVAEGVVCEDFGSALLFEPSEIRNRQGKPFQVFTPFWRECVNRDAPARPLPPPSSVPAPTRWPASLPLGDRELLPRIGWAGGIAKTWTPGEASALRQLRAFAAKAVGAYPKSRNCPSVSGTSRLSPHLHHGEISPRQVWAAVDVGKGAEFLRQLGWREFSHHLLVHFPSTPSKPLRPEFASFPWKRDPASLRLWQEGRTGYPIVDAGMRELWQTGWMHNRVRMIAASFLVKDLLQPWQDGAAWFWDTLVDADLANNTMGWQWTAGCGADAAPYFRIFNPVLQGEKFDPDGAYVAAWLPELARLPARWIHKPWLAPSPVLSAAGVAIGRHYPPPLVDHGAARDAALEAYSAMRGT